MDCTHEADSSDSEVFVSRDTVAALQGQLNHGDIKIHNGPQNHTMELSRFKVKLQ